MLMDAPEASTWRELTKYVWDKKYWQARVRALKQPRLVQVQIGGHEVEGEEFKVSMCTTGPAAITAHIVTS